MATVTSNCVVGAAGGVTVNRRRAPSTTSGGVRTQISRLTNASPQPLQDSQRSIQVSPRPPHAQHVAGSAARRGMTAPSRASRSEREICACTVRGVSSPARCQSRMRSSKACTAGKSMAISSEKLAGRGATDVAASREAAMGARSSGPVECSDTTGFAEYGAARRLVKAWTRCYDAAFALSGLREVAHDRLLN